MIPLLIAGGAAAGLAGGALAANGASRAAKAEAAAAREARGFYDDQTLLGMYRTLSQLYGDAEAERQLRGSLSRDQVDRMFGRESTTRELNDTQRNQLAALERRLGELGGGGFLNRSGAARGEGSASRQREIAGIQEQIANLRGLAGEDPGVTSLLDPNRTKRNTGILAEMDAQNADAEARGNQTLAGFRSDTQRILNGARNIQRGAANFGKQEGERIRRDSGEALQSANREALARLAASGLADSTLVGNQYLENSRVLNNNMQDQLGALGDRQIGLQTGLAQNALNMDSQRSGLGTQLRMGLDEQLFARRQQPLNTRLSVLQGGVMNPWLGQNTSQYFPGTSGSAAASATFGNALGAVGGQMMGYGMGVNQQQGQNTQQQWQGIPYAQ